MFWEPTYGSCTKLIADVARDRFGVDLSSYAELISWADVIDTAGFSSAEAATDPTEPVLQLAAVIEHHADGPFLSALVPRLLDRPPSAVAGDPTSRRAGPRSRPSRRALHRARHAEGAGAAVLVDLTDAPSTSLKFVTYARFPVRTHR